MKRIIIEAEKCDGCKSCSLACMIPEIFIPWI